jgi:hypothetical protein
MSYNTKMVCDIKGCKEFPKWFPKTLAFCDTHWKEIKNPAK